MDIQMQQFLAAQLRKPDGEHGAEVGRQMNEGNAIINRLTIAQLPLQDGFKILELGMGNGYFVGELMHKANDIHYTGCDYSPLMVQHATEMNRQFVEAGSASFHQASADKLPFDDNSFDAIFGINILYFWDTPATELNEIKRVLKPSGTLTIAIRPKSSMDGMPFTQFGFTKYSKESITQLLEYNGYTINRLTEQEEPGMEFNGITMHPASLIATATLVK
jgi:ubiquinone/menaquinone biosynthesis C-methylase UbiE